jgi:drug/metabolite transporter (DMT)-like permease
MIAIALALVYVVWGSTYLAIHYAVRTMPPFIMAAVRFVCAGVLMYAWLRLRGAPRPSIGQWAASALIGALLLGGGNGGVVWAQRTVPSGLTSILVSLVPLWMAVFECFAPKGERPTWLTWFGLLLGFGGLLLLLDVRATGFQLTPGFIALIISPIAWALGSVLAKRVQLPSSPFMATAAQMITGGILLAFMALVSGETQSFHWAQVSAASWVGLIYLMFIGGLIGYTAYVWLLKNAPLTLVSTYAYVNPLVAVLLGWFFVGETFTARTGVAGLVILLSVAITGLSARRKSN